MPLGFLAVGHFGTTVKLTEPKYPRKQLLDKLGASSAVKMYCDTRKGEQKHIGYIIGDEWFTLYEIHEWVGKVA